MAFWGDAGGFLDDLENDETDMGGESSSTTNSSFEVGRDVASPLLVLFFTFFISN